MPDKFKITTVILAIALAHDAQVSHRNQKKFKKRQEDNEILKVFLDYRTLQVDYLLSKLDDYEIPVTEFDKIAMHNLLP